MPKFRVVMLPKRKPMAPWRPTKALAIEDAIRRKLAERDEHKPGRTWWHPLAEIEERQA